MRRKITKAGAGILAAALVMSALPCGGVQAQAAAKKPSLSATSASLSVGSKLTLKVQNKAKGATAKWKTSKKSVASVTQKGVVSGVKAGSATITCTLTTKAKKKTSLKCRVSVSANVEVRTQTQLDKALANKNVKNITIRTAARKTYTIAAGDYSAKGLIVKAPNAEVYNSGAFRAVTIKAIKADTWHENAKGNTIKVTAPQAHIIVAEGAEADSVRVMREGADVKIDVQGKASSVSVEEKATVAVAVTGAVDVRKASTVTADVDGAIGAVAVSEKSALIFTGKTASIPVTVAAGAAGTSVSASAPVRVDTSADVSLELQKGAEGSAVNVNEKASVSVTGDAESATVTVAAGAAGSSVSASVPVSVDTSADVSVELQKGAEGSTVKTQDDSLTVGMDNKTDNAVKVETPSGEKTVNAGASQSVTGTTAQTVTPSAPSTAPNQEVTYPPVSSTTEEETIDDTKNVTVEVNGTFGKKFPSASAISLGSYQIVPAQKTAIGSSTTRSAITIKVTGTSNLVYCEEYGTTNDNYGHFLPVVVKAKSADALTVTTSGIDAEGNKSDKNYNQQSNEFVDLEDGNAAFVCLWKIDNKPNPEVFRTVEVYDGETYTKYTIDVSGVTLNQDEVIAKLDDKTFNDINGVKSGVSIYVNEDLTFNSHYESSQLVKVTASGILKKASGQSLFAEEQNSGYYLPMLIKCPAGADYNKIKVEVSGSAISGSPTKKFAASKSDGIDGTFEFVDDHTKLLTLLCFLGGKDDVEKVRKNLYITIDWRGDSTSTTKYEITCSDEMFGSGSD